MSSLTRLGIAALHTAYAGRIVTPLEVVDAHLDRITRLNGHLNAYIALDEAGARTAAGVSAKRFMAGTARLLEGVPVAVKSNMAVAGLPWDAGMALHRDRIAASDAEVVARLRNAGAVVLGTLNMHEAALGATTDNPWFGRAINPHGQGRTPGGSSGGSGAAVAGALAVAALGTDTLGSVRIPAAYCGIYGLKPSHGALPDAGLEPLCRTLDAIGPLARSLDDLALIWQALSGQKVQTRHPGRVLVLDALGGVAVEPAVQNGYDRACAVLPPDAAISLPGGATGVRLAGFALAAAEMARHLGRDRQSDLLSPELKFLLDFGESRPPNQPLLLATRRALVQALGDDGVLLLPTAPQAAFVQGGDVPVTQADFTGLANIAGLPALSLPAGQDDDGMPVAVQLVGPAGGEDLLFAAARRLDAELQSFAWPQ